MNLTRTTTLRLIRYGIISILAALIVTYAIWRSFNYARGPQIEIVSPRDGSSATTSVMRIEGRAVRVSAISMNGNPIYIDLEGNFHQILSIFPGENIITFDAADQFGRKTEKSLRIFGLSALPPAKGGQESAATSTASTTGI